jgi:hypothetical protein
VAPLHRECLIWAGIGILTAALGVAFMLRNETARGLDPQFLPTAANVAHRRGRIGSGIAVALFEETLRAARCTRRSSANPAPGRPRSSPHCLFAVLHFFAKTSIRPDELAWRSGFDLLARSFAPLSIPRWWRFSAGLFGDWPHPEFDAGPHRQYRGRDRAARRLGRGAANHAAMHGAQRSARSCVSGSVNSTGLVGLWVLPWAAAIGLGLWFMRAYWVAGPRDQ